MKNGKLILTKENLMTANYDTLKKLYGGREGTKDFLDLIKMMCDEAKRTKQIKSFMIPKNALTVMIYYLPKVKDCLIELIAFPKPDELVKSVLLMLITESPYNLYYNITQLAGNYRCSTLTYNYTITYNKEHGKYEVKGINTEGILK